MAEVPRIFSKTEIIKEHSSKTHIGMKLHIVLNVKIRNKNYPFRFNYIIIIYWCNQIEGCWRIIGSWNERIYYYPIISCSIICVVIWNSAFCIKLSPVISDTKRSTSCYIFTGLIKNILMVSQKIKIIKLKKKGSFEKEHLHYYYS